MTEREAVVDMGRPGWLERLAPRLHFRLRQRWRAHLLHRPPRDRQEEASRAEHALLRALCDPTKDAVDAGAHRGDYTLDLAPASRRVYAFEPQPEFAERLRRLARAAPYDIVVEPFALSDHEGTATIRVPEGRPGTATLEAGNTFVNRLAESQRVATREVMLRRLDDYGLDAVQVIKIDVEGHQLPLLQGAAATLKRCKPHLLVEIDERQGAGAVARVNGHLRDLGYDGWFLVPPVLLPMREFRVDLHQSAGDPGEGRLYVNDFFYIHRDRLAEAQARCPPGTFHDA